MILIEKVYPLIVIANIIRVHFHILYKYSLIARFTKYIFGQRMENILL